MLGWTSALAATGERLEPPEGRRVVGERHTTAVIGIGPAASQFTARVCAEVARLYAHPPMAAVGVYDPSATGDEARAALSQLPFASISVTATQHHEIRNEQATARDVDIAHLTDIENALLRAERVRQQPLEHLVWIVDAERVDVSAETLRSLKRLMARTLITVVCFLPPLIRDAAALDTLARLQAQDPVLGQPVLGTALLIDRQSPLVREIGASYQDALLARSLATMLFAPLAHEKNPPFSKVMRMFQEAGYPFAAMALDSGGVKILEPAKWTRRVTAQLTGAPAPVNVDYAHARWRLIEVIDALFTGQAAGTLHTPLERALHPVHVAALVPYDRRDKRFEDLAADLSRWLSHVYGVASPTIAQGPGVDLSGVRPDRRGDLYCQVGVLYGVPYHIPAPAAPTRPRVRVSAPPPIEASVREEPSAPEMFEEVVEPPAASLAPAEPATPMDAETAERDESDEPAEAARGRKGVDSQFLL
jgi:hypothetical protein